MIEPESRIAVGLRAEDVRKSSVVEVEAVDDELVDIDPRITRPLVARFAVPPDDGHGHLMISVGKIVFREERRIAFHFGAVAVELRLWLSGLAGPLPESRQRDPAE